MQIRHVLPKGLSSAIINIKIVTLRCSFRCSLRLQYIFKWLKVPRGLPEETASALGWRSAATENIREERGTFQLDRDVRETPLEREQVWNQSIGTQAIRFKWPKLRATRRMTSDDQFLSVDLQGIVNMPPSQLYSTMVKVLLICSGWQSKEGQVAFLGQSLPNV